MTDLTVLIAPTPLYPLTDGFTFGRRLSRRVSKPVMVTLESEPDLPMEEDTGQENVENGEDSSGSGGSGTSYSIPRRSRSPRPDSNLLSPPINTWKSPDSARARTRHRPTRSQSAPPERIPGRELGSQPSSPPSNMLYTDGSGIRPPQRSYSSFGTKGGEILPPPPPLLRPTTFWRKTRRSAVSAVSYAPSSYVVRRSTYIAAGLTFDAPIHDLSALSVESRVGYIVVPPNQALE